MVHVPIDRLLTAFPVVDCPPWGDLPEWITPRAFLDSVLRCIRRGVYEMKPASDPRSSRPYNHAARIAWLAAIADDAPIEIDVGVPVLGHIESWIVLDGNHRLYAAWIRGARHVPANIGGQLDYASELLQVAVETL